MLLSWFFFNTLATANSKSSCVTCCRRSRSAYIPTFMSITQEKLTCTNLLLCKYPLLQLQNMSPSSRREDGGLFHVEETSRSGQPAQVASSRSLALREWMRKIETRASGPGGGNSIFRSMRPGLRSAESRMSIKPISAKIGGRTEAEHRFG